MLAPPPSDWVVARKYGEIGSNGRASTAHTSAATPPPAASATSASRARRSPWPRAAGGDSAGSQCSASIIRMMVATSTSNCVSARSGAEKYTKARLTTSPTAPSSNSASSRWRWKRTVASVVARPMTQATMKPKLTGGPSGMATAVCVPPCTKGSAPAMSETTTSTSR